MSKWYNLTEGNNCNWKYMIPDISLWYPNTRHPVCEVLHITRAKMNSNNSVSSSRIDRQCGRGVYEQHAMSQCWPSCLHCRTPPTFLQSCSHYTSVPLSHSSLACDKKHKYKTTHFQPTMAMVKLILQVVWLCVCVWYWHLMVNMWTGRAGFWYERYHTG